MIGIPPSAAAAAVLAEQAGIRTDTLAKLTWSLDHGELPDWAAAVGPATLVIIDEAGMADTLTLDGAVRFAISRGASVRLVGDDQQLAAIGAGGVLRDIKQTRGALRLTELHRFTDVGEAAASLALRGGKPEALDFYLDHGRVHVGDVATTTEDAFSAWVSDRAAGLDGIMIAPTRQLVAELNRRAKQHRLDHCAAAAEVPLRALNNPAAQLFHAVQRYTDGLHVAAAEQLVGPRAVAELDQADQYIPGLTTEPAWPTLRATAAETDEHPLCHLLTVASGRDLRTANDMAAVIDWRLTAHTPADPGPLPWLRGIPETLRSHPAWGPIWRGHDDRQRPHNNANGVRAGRPPPADSASHSDWALGT